MGHSRRLSSTLVIEDLNRESSLAFGEVARGQWKDPGSQLKTSRMTQRGTGHIRHVPALEQEPEA